MLKFFCVLEMLKFKSAVRQCPLRAPTRKFLHATNSLLKISPKVDKKGLIQTIKDAGWIGTTSWVVFNFSCLGSIYMAVRLGLGDWMEQTLQSFGVNIDKETFALKYPQLSMDLLTAVIIMKLVGPIRIAIFLTILPVIVKFVRKVPK